MTSYRSKSGLMTAAVVPGEETLANRIGLASQKLAAVNDWSTLQVALGRGWKVAQ